MSAFGIRDKMSRQTQRSGLFGRGLLYVVIWSLQLIVGVLVSPILAHILPKEEFGALASGIALHQVMSILALLGIDKALVLQRKEDDDSRGARKLITVGISLSLLTACCFGLTSPIWRGALGFAEYPDLVLIVVMWTGPAAAIQVMLALLLAEDKFREFALLSGASALGGQFIGLILLATVENDVITYAWGGVISQACAMVVGIIFTRPLPISRRDWQVTKRAIRLGFPLSVAGLAFLLLSAGDRIIVQVILGSGEVARYQVAYIVGSVVILLLTFVSSAWMPHFAAERDAVQRYEMAVECRNDLYRILMPVVLAVTLAAPLLLEVVSPRSFMTESLLSVVFLVAVASFPFASSVASNQLLVTEHRGYTVGIITAVAAIANIIANFILIPVAGILGAAIATVGAYWLLAALQGRALVRNGIWRRPPIALSVVLPVVVSSAAASTYLPQTLGWNVVRLLLALGCLPWFCLALYRARQDKNRANTPSATDLASRSSALDTGTPSDGGALP
jgi:O-antigen/teichoic acid export membrane protein